MEGPGEGVGPVRQTESRCKVPKAGLRNSTNARVSEGCRHRGPGPDHTGFAGPGFYPRCAQSSSGQVTRSPAALVYQSPRLLPHEMTPHPDDPTSTSTSQILFPKPHTRCNSPKLDVATASENLFNQAVTSPPRVC